MYAVGMMAMSIVFDLVYEEILHENVLPTGGRWLTVFRLSVRFAVRMSWELLVRMCVMLREMVGTFAVVEAMCMRVVRVLLHEMLMVGVLGRV